jgi:ABC-2 type transport system ATP-binding protein
MIALSVRELTKDYGKIRAVDGISFDVDEGEIFGLIGPNGAGKTTTLRIVSTLLEPSAGEVRIFDHDVVKEGARVRNLISYLPEEAGAYKKLKGLAYLNFMAGFYAETWSQKEKMVEEALSIAGLGDRIKDKVEHYSKGMVRKLLVARALMHKPRLAILDEPTSGLDVLNSIEVRNIIIEYAKQGTTVLLSSHNMLEVEFLSTRVSLIDRGKLLQTGIASELKKKYGAKNLEEVFVRALKSD